MTAQPKQPLHNPLIEEEGKHVAVEVASDGRQVVMDGHSKHALSQRVVLRYRITVFHGAHRKHSIHFLLQSSQQHSHLLPVPPAHSLLDMMHNSLIQLPIARHAMQGFNVFAQFGVDIIAQHAQHLTDVEPMLWVGLQAPVNYPHEGLEGFYILLVLTNLLSVQAFHTFYYPSVSKVFHIGLQAVMHPIHSHL